MIAGNVSHDKITQFLSGQYYAAKYLWHQVKSTLQQMDRHDGVLIFDDTI